MKIREAIKILTAMNRAKSTPGHINQILAVALSIQALKAVKDTRANNYSTPIPTLMHETEE